MNTQGTKTAQLTEANILDFSGLGIAPRLLETLRRINITVPTPIQHKAIPSGLAGRDIVGIAQTGTGKTLAFAIPMLQRLAAQKGRGLILVPTRELAVQVSQTFYKIGYSFGMKLAVLIGGADMRKQISALRSFPRILIATPGRLIDHIEQGNVSLRDISIMVIDEADRMLDMGFLPQIRTVLRTVPTERQTMLFSATIPREVMEIASKWMKLPVSVEIARSGTLVDKVTHELYIVKRELKSLLLSRLLSEYKGSVLLFSRTKIGAEKITRSIRRIGHSAAEIHSDRSLFQRSEALEGFKTGKYRVLVATDIAARGIDVSNIELVINYDIPEDPESYVHRIGRTARAGLKGHAISFATPIQAKEVGAIEKLIRIKVPVSTHPDLPKEEFFLQPPPAAEQSWKKHRPINKVFVKRRRW